MSDDLSILNFNKIIHIRIKQRKAKSYITSIENLPGNLDVILKKLKKSLCCSGTLDSDGIIKLNGDHRDVLKQMTAQICKEDEIMVHGI